ncbi:NUDIX hydrolase [Streptomyces johnsoniae]|uniref:NUDIX hydrolase n=1 Tax=Streptomyces johnsoniae TaxID=3075532 RepID=A0ABU2S2J3_9ACTN|nr:NUDIX hydrolase [Streptomyces sp. DSM 41886]MDT0442019.1 NUDIX hydrolase [Streptomyces sp. DSM 41886]
MVPDVVPVRAAGCVLWRRAAPGGEGIEVALVHRPKYDDWSHPKGKLYAGEPPADAARREVLEETGAEIRLGQRLSTHRYPAQGRPKVVDYWVAEAVGGRFEPNAEVDRLLWLPPPEARRMLTHPANQTALDEAMAAIRAEWQGAAADGRNGEPPPASAP